MVKLIAFCLLFCGNITTAICQSHGSFSVWDIQEKRQIVLNQSKHSHSLFVFLSPECPLCQNYSKTINELKIAFDGSLTIYGIVPGTSYADEDIMAFKEEYGLLFDLFIDKTFVLSQYFSISVTPEVVLLNKNGNKVYTGAIDNWVVSLGQKRNSATVPYLKNALTESLANQPISVTYVQAIGCALNDY
ncbi:Thioredoxin-like domain-containing protein [Parapedobacter composti]|uniref:Thioredoxin-like domain-containing protein n=2 Tax=Parapedobacter composti TaxID=623281 RepID=A0A1I1ECP6_9SPHI|nr:Thioredoxin-like domain-containing protein [Parapedobacter composti]